MYDSTFSSQLGLVHRFGDLV